MSLCALLEFFIWEPNNKADGKQATPASTSFLFVVTPPDKKSIKHNDPQPVHTHDKQPTNIEFCDVTNRAVTWLEIEQQKK